MMIPPSEPCPIITAIVDRLQELHMMCAEGFILASLATQTLIGVPARWFPDRAKVRYLLSTGDNQPDMVFEL